MSNLHPWQWKPNWEWLDTLVIPLDAEEGVLWLHVCLMPCELWEPMTSVASVGRGEWGTVSKVGNSIMRLEEHSLQLFIPRREPKRNVCFSPCNKSAVNSLKHMDEVLPWWLGGKESTCWCSRHGLDLWSRKIPHTAVEQLSPCYNDRARVLEPGATTAGRTHTCLQQEKPLQGEAHAPQQRAGSAHSSCRKPGRARKKKKHSPKQISKTCTKEYAWEGKYFTAWTFVLVKVIECRYDWQITLLKHLSFLLTLGFLVDHQLVWPQKWGHKTCQTWWRKTCVFEI